MLQLAPSGQGVRRNLCNGIGCVLEPFDLGQLSSRWRNSSQSHASRR
jgi:hypothetical protein